MKYRATISTKHSTGQIESESKQEIMDALEAWFLDYEIDAKDNVFIPNVNKGPIVTCWQKKRILITCNFEIKNQ
tara:strand:- start:141 stop:362 length:222 start_codon:yes stop_codon:yes gene_type:complete